MPIVQGVYVYFSHFQLVPGIYQPTQNIKLGTLGGDRLLATGSVINILSWNHCGREL